MRVKPSKTFTQLVGKQDEVEKATEEEVKKKTSSYKFECTYAAAGCSQRFKTKKGMRIHASSCNFNYGTTAEAFNVECITEVFGKASRKLVLVKWENFPGEDSWVPEDSLLQDGCADFWTKTGRNPTLSFYPDPDARRR